MKTNSKIPNEQTLLDNLGKIAYTLDKTYLAHLDTYYNVLPFDEYYNQDKSISYAANIRALKVDRWVYDKDEKVADCFKNVLSVFAGSDSSLALVVKRTPVDARIFFITKNIGQARNEDSKNNIGLLADALRGNFPGTKVSILDTKTKEIEQEFDLTKYQSIASLCNVPSEKSQDYICQGIDKLLSGIIPKTEEDSYLVIILADALPPETLRQILNGYQEMATVITPFAGYQFQAGENATETEGEMESLSHSEGVSHSITKTHSINIGMNGGVQSSTTMAAGLGILGIFTSMAHTMGQSIGASVGYGYSWGTTDTKSEMDTTTTGTNRSISLGTSENTTYTYKSYLVSDIIEKLVATIKRINESQSTGLWKYASYVCSKNAKSSKNIANFLRSIMQGNESYIEPSFIQEWSYQEINGLSPFNEIKKYIQHFCHPIFRNMRDSVFVSPTMNVSTTELSDVIAFPRCSVQGLPIIECVRFGREPHSLGKLSNDINIGNSYHMQQEEDRKIFINKDELAKHTFITGSTGSGKSNAIYKILSELDKQKVKYLVIEPAKGEYKNILGHMKDVSVYGTNPKKMPLLRINPFKFANDIHVLEHLDRLIEIFNVCWPMYAAMPAILKDAIERAYISSGWDLQKSENKYDNNLFPTFADVLEQIRTVLTESDYSADNKNDYIGALATRLKSLTNGINGMIFVSDSLSDSELFDENVIVDLSRVGSTETKALAMGLLIMKLHEYRMTSGKQNARLTHVTVLEEAHHLLRRTSTEQSINGANLLGKSVEMLANAIAEMRTYGEGFIIADQSPGLLDISVIRNTNTKVILRLPDASDRELVGKAVGLNENQIVELSKLERGVAVLSQSDWLEPVLCKIAKYDSDEKPYTFNNDQCLNNSAQQALLKIIMNKELYRCGDSTELKQLHSTIMTSNLKTSVKIAFIDYINHYAQNDREKLRKFVYEFFEAENAFKSSKNNNEIVELSKYIAEKLIPSIIKYSKEQINLVLLLIMEEQALRDILYNNTLIRFCEVYKNQGGVV